MGTRVAPSYANIFMERFEETYVYTHRLRPFIWLRFIDDVWGIFRGKETEYQEFFKDINSKHPSIKFTEEHSKEKVIFLDLITYKVHDEIHTRTHFKPTDSHSYLNYESCHKPSTKNSIPYSQFLRIKRNSSDWTHFATDCMKLYHYFTMRGYPPEILRNKMKAVSETNNQPQNNNQVDTKEFFLITQLNPSLPNMRQIIEKFWPLLDRSSSTRCLMNCSITYGNTRPKNIGDIITHTNLPTNKGVKRIPPKCNKVLNCNHCPKIVKKGKIISTSTSRTYKIPKRVTCTSKGLIYCIECQTCSIQYVGQTRNKLLTRINSHLSDIRTKKDTPVSRHFNQHELKYNLYILQLCKDNQEDRNKHENNWIARLNTITPKGLNILD